MCVSFVSGKVTANNGWLFIPFHFSLRIVEELIEGLNTYFNFFLHTLLLYNFEREQYQSFFPLQKVPPHLLSLHVSTPPVTPILSPKAALLAAMEKSHVESKESSRSNSRSSSFSEDVPVSTSIRKRGRERRSINQESTEHKRKRDDSFTNIEKPMSPLLDPGYIACKTVAHDSDSSSVTTSSKVSGALRETRSTRSTKSSDNMCVKEEPIDFSPHKADNAFPHRNIEGASRNLIYLVEFI